MGGGRLSLIQSRSDCEQAGKIVVAKQSVR